MVRDNAGEGSVGRKGGSRDEQTSVTTITYSYIFRFSRVLTLNSVVRIKLYYASEHVIMNNMYVTRIGAAALLTAGPRETETWTSP